MGCVQKKRSPVSMGNPFSPTLLLTSMAKADIDIF
jgi:hypothetical protein